MANVLDDASKFGSAMGDVPIGSMLLSMGQAIAQAQAELDANSVQWTRTLARERISVLDADGNPVEKSLLELGLRPTFYFFQEATLDLAFTISMRASEAETTGVTFNLGADFRGSSGPSGESGEGEETGAGPQRSEENGEEGAEGETEGEGSEAAGGGGGTMGGGVMFGLAVNHENTRKYGFGAEGATRMVAKLVSVPPPGALIDTLRDDSTGVMALLMRERQGVCQVSCIRVGSTPMESRPAGATYSVQIDGASPSAADGLTYPVPITNDPAADAAAIAAVTNSDATLRDKVIAQARGAVVWLTFKDHTTHTVDGQATASAGGSLVISTYREAVAVAADDSYVSPDGE